MVHPALQPLMDPEHAKLIIPQNLAFSSTFVVGENPE